MSKFLRVECRCGKDWVVFSDSTLEVNCVACGEKLLEPTGGKARINCRVLEVLS